jgi:endoglucanase
MFERARRSLPALCAAVLLACGGGGEAASAPAPTAPQTPVVNGNTPASARAWSTAAAMARGINFGNMLEAPREGDWGVRADDEFIALVGTGGFTNAVRLPVRWSNHASADALATIDPAFMARVDSVVTKLLARGATVLMDMHHYRQLDGDALDPGEARVPDAVLQERFIALWRQIATHFAGRDPRLVFELYNEPHGALEPHWNALIARTLPVVRASNPDRIVVVGPVQWNSARELPRLMLPNDANLVLTVHNYEPFNFTHQGAAWITPPLPTGTDCCDAEQQRRMTEPLDLARADSQRRKVPIFVGEFGAYSQAPLAARVRYLRLMRDAMAARELPWFYWELASGFGLYDPQAHRFRDELKGALYGP